MFRTLSCSGGGGGGGASCPGQSILPPPTWVSKKNYFAKSTYFKRLIMYRHENLVICQLIKAGLQIRPRIEKLFSLFLIQTYVVVTQTNRLNETVFMSTQTHV